VNLGPLNNAGYENTSGAGGILLFTFRLPWVTIQHK